MNDLDELFNQDPYELSLADFKALVRTLREKRRLQELGKLKTKSRKKREPAKPA